MMPKIEEERFETSTATVDRWLRGRSREIRAMRAAALSASVLLALAPSLAGAVVAAERASNADANVVPDRERYDNSHAQRMMNGFAACTAKLWRHDAELFLARFPGSPDSVRQARLISASNCIRNSEALTFNVDLLRGALFNVIYVADFGAGPIADIRDVPQIDYSLGSETADPRKVAWQMVEWRFADCVARADPGGARALILSEVASRNETEAFAALRPNLARCLPGGAPLRFTRPILRGLVAESLYRLSAAKAGFSPLGTRS